MAVPNVEVFVEYVEPNRWGPLAWTFLIVFVIAVAASAIAVLGSNHNDPDTDQSGRDLLVGMTSLTGVVLLLGALGIPGKWMHSPSIWGQSRTVPVAQLHEHTGIPSAVFPKIVERCPTTGTTLLDGVTLHCSEGPHGGKDGKFWAVVTTGEGVPTTTETITVRWDEIS